jgi:hypothetical protein
MDVKSLIEIIEKKIIKIEDNKVEVVGSTRRDGEIDMMKAIIGDLKHMIRKGYYKSLTKEELIDILKAEIDELNGNKDSFKRGQFSAVRELLPLVQELEL